MAEVLAPFKVSVSDQVLTDLRSRLAVARIPAPPPGEAWSQGTDPEFLRRLRDYWLNEFDWRGAEAKLNSLDQFTTSIDDVDIHFIHQRSPHPEALPLVVSHGWPGSIAEFHNIIGPLTNPTAYGADAGDAFHVVCPSLPGHGFSGAPKEPGWDLRRIAGAFVQLMARLGYDRYGAQGGDWGAVISTHIADLDPSHTVGIHLNIVPTLPPEDDPMAGVLPEEAAQLQDFQQFQRQETGYQEIHRTKPQTLGSALNDSPLGLAAWIVEKFRSWTDCDGDVERAITFDELLTNITIYWVTETITPSHAPLSRGRSRWRVRSPPPTRRGARRMRHLPQGAAPTASSLGRTSVQPRALAIDAARWPLRRARAAGAARRGHPDVLQAVAMTRVVCPRAR